MNQMTQEQEQYRQPDLSTLGKEERAVAIKALVEQGCASLVEELKQGHTEPFLAYLRFLARFHRYSHDNQMLIFLQKPDASLVAGYKRWQELGYQVKKGEHAIWIWAPIKVKQKEVTEDGEEVVVERIVSFKPVPVFDASQLVNPPEDPFPCLPDDAHKQFDLVYNAVTLSQIGVLERRLPKDIHGRSLGSFIELQAGLDSRRKTKTLIHEWGHELLHRQWMTIEDALAKIPKPVRELQVESVAYIVGRYLGIDDPFKSSANYILAYGNAAETLIANMELVQRASTEMIEHIEGVAKGRS